MQPLELVSPPSVIHSPFAMNALRRIVTADPVAPAVAPNVGPMMPRGRASPPFMPLNATCLCTRYGSELYVYYLEAGQIWYRWLRDDRPPAGTDERLRRLRLPVPIRQMATMRYRGDVHLVALDESGCVITLLDEQYNSECISLHRRVTLHNPVSMLFGRALEQEGPVLLYESGQLGAFYWKRDEVGGRPSLAIALSKLGEPMHLAAPYVCNESRVLAIGRSGIRYYLRGVYRSS